MSRFNFGGGTNVGNKRKQNEDNYEAVPDIGLWVVADGMGGAKGGEVASRIAVQEVVSGVKRNLSLTESILSAHKSITKSANSNQKLMGMGSTIVALKCDGQSGYEVAWVGDSRAYIWDKSLSRLTQDHSYVQQLINNGELSVEESWGHPKSNVIVQALGMINKEIKVDVYTGQWRKGQKILLCSDGLHGELQDAEIESIVSRNLPAQDIVNLLIDSALNHGGRDNISVLLISYLGPQTVENNTGDQTIPYDQNISRDYSSSQTAFAINKQTQTSETRTSQPEGKKKARNALLISLLVLLLVCLFKLLSSA